MAERETNGPTELQRARGWTKSPIRNAVEWGSLAWGWLRRRRERKAIAEAEQAAAARQDGLEPIVERSDT